MNNELINELSDSYGISKVSVRKYVETILAVLDDTNVDYDDVVVAELLEEVCSRRSALCADVLYSSCGKEESLHKSVYLTVADRFFDGGITSDEYDESNKTDEQKQHDNFVANYKWDKNRQDYVKRRHI